MGIGSVSDFAERMEAHEKARARAKMEQLEEEEEAAKNILESKRYSLAGPAKRKQMRAAYGSQNLKRWVH